MSWAVLTRQAPAVTGWYQENLDHSPGLKNIDGTRVNIALPVMRLNLFGGFQLTWGGRTSAIIEMPRLQALLAYLMLHAGEPQSRTQLAFLLWPDSTEAQAHTNLRNLIFKLRQALPDVEDWLQVERHTLLWREGVSWTLDVLEFEQALAEADGTCDQDTLRRALERAVNLYRGSLLPSCYDEWIIPERDRLEQAMLQALERLITVLEQEHDYAGAIRAAQRLLRYNPLREESYRCLMRLHARRCDRSAILRTYQNCAAVLKRELGIGPGKTTRQAFAQFIRADQ